MKTIVKVLILILLIVSLNLLVLVWYGLKEYLITAICLMILFVVNSIPRWEEE